MFHALVRHIEPLLQHYGALGVFFASVAEELVAPIPTTVVVFTSGLLLTKGMHGSAALVTILWKIMLPASLGMTLGSLCPYFIARIGERVAIDRFGKFLHVDWAMVEKVQAWTKKSSSDELVIFLTRAIPGVPTLAVSVLCGLARIPLGEYVLWTFLGCLPRTFLLGLAGWWGGRQYGFAMEMLNSLEDHIMVILLTVLLTLYIVWLFPRKKSNQ